MTTKTDTQAAFEKWLGARADDPSLPHGLMRDAFCAGAEADRQGRMPSDEEIIASVVAYGEACASLNTATEREMRLHDIRALLSRYSSGQHAASAEPVVMKEICPECGHQFECFHNPYINQLRVSPVAAPVAQEPVAGRDLLRRAKVVLELIDKDRGSTICAGGLVSDISTYLAAPVAAQAQPVAFAKDGVLFWHGEHAAWRGFSGDLYLAAQADVGIPISRTAAPLAAQASAQDREDDEALADTQRAIIEAAERRGYARAEAENVGYRTDAGRYRFIRPGDKDVWCSSGDDLLTGDRLDAAIDAARAAKGADHG